MLLQNFFLLYFQLVFDSWTEEDWEDELYTTLAHEFTHHIEGRAGERGLEIKDEQFMEEFRAEREE